MGKIQRILRNIKKMLTTPSLSDGEYNAASISRYRISIGKEHFLQGKVEFINWGTFTIGHKFRGNSGQVYNPIGGDSELRLICWKGAKLTIGNNVGISNSTIVCSTEITIEDNVMIGGSCKIYDTDFHSVDMEKRISHSQEINTKSVLLKRGAFIGAHSIVLKGVTIGENSVIGAGSVVAKSVPDNEIWAGNPASFVKKV